MLTLVRADGTFVDLTADQSEKTLLGVEVKRILLDDLYRNVTMLVDRWQAHEPEWLIENAVNITCVSDEQENAIEDVDTLAELRDWAEARAYCQTDVYNEIEVLTDRDFLLALRGALKDAMVDALDQDDEEAVPEPPENDELETLITYAEEHGVEDDVSIPKDRIALVRAGMRQYLLDAGEAEGYAEVYEWWAISGWLHGKLEAAGEVVGDLEGLPVWGRCCTGQAIYLDGIIQRIALEWKWDGKIEEHETHGHPFDPAEGYRLALIAPGTAHRPAGEATGGFLCMQSARTRRERHPHLEIAAYYVGPSHKPG